MRGATDGRRRVGGTSPAAAAVRHASGRVDRLDDALPAPRPVALQVELTSRCQLRCRMCPLTTGTSSTSTSPGHMAPALAGEVLRLARGCGRVILAGYGEPLTDAQCLPLLRALNAAGVIVAMSTNGLALTPAVAAALVGLEHLTLINVSIDSPDPATYRAVRGGSAERALAGLRNLMAVVDDPSRVTVSAVALDDTVPALVRFPAILASLGVRRFQLQAAIDYTPYAIAHRLLDHGDLARSLQEIEAGCAAHGIDLELSVPERLRHDVQDPDAARSAYYGPDSGWDPTRTRMCHVPWEIPFIDKDGSVFPCCFAASQNASRMGSITTTPFEDIWAGPGFRRFRAAITDGRTTPDICRRCTVAPLGRHLFRAWAASVESVDVALRSWTAATVTVRVRNTGEDTWTPESHVRVGTSDPRDTVTSPLRHRTWLSTNRAAEVRAVVAPGETATIVFDVGCPRLRDTTATFELVAEGACWLPNTRFEVTVRTRGALRPAAAGVRRLRGRFSRRRGRL